MLKLALGSALLVTATQAVAVSLGALQGSAFIGRPLDLLVQSNITDADAAAGLCLQPEVFYGQRRIPITAIHAVIHRAGADGSGALRIRVSEPVNEPIVTLVLRAGCAAPFQRSYTMLADIEPRPAPPVRVDAPVAAGAAPVPVLQPLVPSPGHGQDVLADPHAQPQAAESVAQTPIRLAQPMPRPAAVTRMWSKTRSVPAFSPGLEGDLAADRGVALVAEPGPATAAHSRLQLEPVDLSAPGAFASAQGEQGGPVATGQEAVVAAPEPDAAADALAKQQALEQEILTLRAEQERMRLALEAVNAQLKQAQSSSSPLTLVYGLSALSLMLLGGLWFVMRSRRLSEKALDGAASSAWWEPQAPDAESPVKAVQGQADSSAPLGASMGETASWSDAPVQGLEVAERGESLFHEVPVSPLDLQRLQDVWQQVGFLVSIGQYRDAMDALKDLVLDSPRSSVAPYLWWLQLAHVYADQADRDEASRLYESHFQYQVPHLAQLQAPLGLEDDLALQQSLAWDWPSAAARQRLLAALASQPGDADAPLQVRTLAAFDDLITLLGLLDTLDALELTQAFVTPMGRSVLAEPVAEPQPLPSSQAMGDLSETTRPMLEFDFSSVAAVSAKPQTKPPASPDPRALDFDFDLFDLQSKEGKPERDGAEDEPGAKT